MNLKDEEINIIIKPAFNKEKINKGLER